jgi:NAD(P)H dehydrogenase (quinone)
MESKTLLITGATGATGSRATEFLLKKCHKVRALVHKDDERSSRLNEMGAEVVVGDLLDLDSVRAALEGVTAAYFVYRIRSAGLLDATAFMAQAAKEAGVKAIVNMSQISARREAKSHAARDFWVSERIFDWSGIQVTHLRPTFFAEWLLYPLPGWNVKEGIIRFPLGEGHHAPIAAFDQGRVIAAILADPEPHAGKVYPLFGREELNHYQIAAKLSAVLGRSFRYEPMSIPDFATLMESAGLSARFVQHIRSVAQDYLDGIFSGTNDVIKRLTGLPPLTVEQFVEMNRAGFDA